MCVDATTRRPGAPLLGRINYTRPIHIARGVEPLVLGDTLPRSGLRGLGRANTRDNGATVVPRRSHRAASPRRVP